MKGVLIVLVAVLGAALAKPNHEKCGDRPFHRAGLQPVQDDLSRVVGGNLSVTGDHGWQIALLRNGAFICGGSIIDDDVILCAAHCTTLSNPGLYTVIRTSKRNPLDGWSQSRTVRQIISHPAYSSSTYNNDISLIVLTSAFDTSPDHVNHICFDGSNPHDDQLAVSTGWGSTVSGGSVQNDIREAYMPITREAAIRVQYGNSYNPVTMIGAAYQGDGLDTCQGDSGGPLSCSHHGNSDMSKLTQVGIVSWGYGCGGIGIYTRVSNYIGWIEGHINVIAKSRAAN